jgi:hypothetical protein
MTDPTRLVQWSVTEGKPIIVVAIKQVCSQVTELTISWRLGPFNFLYSTDLDKEYEGAKEPFRGNFGLHDQRLALEWVQRNIQGFGGDVCQNNRPVESGQTPRADLSAFPSDVERPE